MRLVEFMRFGSTDVGVWRETAIKVCIANNILARLYRMYLFSYK